MQTLREVIAGLEKMTALLDEPVVFSLWYSDDVSLYAEDFDTTDDVKDMWENIAIEFEGVLNSGFIVEQLNDSIGRLLEQYYEPK